MDNQLLEYFQAGNLLTESQSGFRPNHSTCTALISLVNLWLVNMDAGRLNGSVFIERKPSTLLTITSYYVSCVVMVSMALLFSCLNHI